MIKVRLLKFGILLISFVLCKSLLADETPSLQYNGHVYMSADNDFDPVIIHKASDNYNNAKSVTSKTSDTKSVRPNVNNKKDYTLKPASKPLTYKPTKLNFKSLDVQGKIEKPRIVFTRDELPVNHIGVDDIVLGE